MFGYVVVNKPELKIKDFDMYKSFYCGLCRSLHRMFGRSAQVALNYDLTFLAILLTGLYEPDTQIIQERCVIHPLGKHTKLQNTYIEYAAEMTVVLTYLKCEDDWKDEHRYRSKAFMSMLKNRYLSIKEKYPEKISRIETALHQIHDLEEQGSSDLDKISATFGIVMGEILAYQEDVWKSSLYTIGDYLGRFIYIMDAYDDVEEDIKKGSFNPFQQDLQNENFDERVKMILELMIASSADAFEMLPILEHVDILRNIMYSGIWAKYETVRKKRSGEEDAKSV
ncbi:DUF5685 family protein [Amedibacillus sp. YH-ame10]